MKIMIALWNIKHIILSLIILCSVVGYEMYAHADTPPAGTGVITGTVDVRPNQMFFGGTNVVVWVDNPPPHTLTANGATATLGQHAMSFYPFLSVIRAGGKLVIVNNDPFPHNVFTVPANFNSGTMPGHGSAVHQFNEVGHWSILCNLHPNMIAHLLVVPSDMFARPDKDGKFSLPNLPDGTYTLKAWGGGLDEVSQQVVVSNGSGSVQLHLHRHHD